MIFNFRHSLRDRARRLIIEIAALALLDIGAGKPPPIPYFEYNPLIWIFIIKGSVLIFYLVDNKGYSLLDIWYGFC